MRSNHQSLDSGAVETLVDDAELLEEPRVRPRRSHSGTRIKVGVVVPDSSIEDQADSPAPSPSVPPPVARSFPPSMPPLPVTRSFPPSMPPLPVTRSFPPSMPPLPTIISAGSVEASASPQAAEQHQDTPGSLARGLLVFGVAIAAGVALWFIAASARPSWNQFQAAPPSHAP